MEGNFRGQNTGAIYDMLISNVDNLMSTINVQSSNEVIQAAQQESSVILKQLQERITEENNALKRNTVWDKFTVAFYGETNAGKSTIIEMLRLVLHEQTKEELQKKFKELQEKNNVTQENFDAIRKEIADFEEKIRTLSCEKKALSNEKEKEIDSIRKKIEDLEVKIQVEAAVRSFWEKIIHIFKKTPLEKELKITKVGLIAVDKKYVTREKGIDAKITEIESQKANKEKDEDVLKEKCKELEPYADGKIIGTGVSDFTKTNTVYSFDHQGTKFDLIDVPGIEGNEGIVMDAIMEAVQKAHAVFYVTRKPAAPQTGDGKEGTLEKIKKHLGAQTEVWTIFNQSVTNPIRLGAPLASEDDHASLQEMNGVLKNTLGEEHYRGEIVLSAYPAFLSVADCLVPGTAEYQNREKFLKKYSTTDLLDLTKVQEFLGRIPNEIIGNWQDKILQSNYNKAISTLEKAIEQVKIIKETKFIPLEQDMRRTVDSSKEQVENSARFLSTAMEGVKADVVNEFRKEALDRIYSRIDEDIDNDEFKSALRYVVDKAQENLKSNFANMAKQKTADFSQTIETIVDKNKMYVSDLISSYNSRPASQELSLNINIKSNFGWGNLLGIGGGIVAVLTTGGWALALGAISLVWNILKAVWGFFNHSYRKEQQRKSANENIRNACGQIEQAIVSCLTEQKEIVQEQVNKILEQLDNPVVVIEQINGNLDRAENDLKNLAREMSC